MKEMKKSAGDGRERGTEMGGRGGGNKDEYEGEERRGEEEGSSEVMEVRHGGLVSTNMDPSHSPPTVVLFWLPLLDCSLTRMHTHTHTQIHLQSLTHTPHTHTHTHLDLCLTQTEFANDINTVTL